MSKTEKYEEIEVWVDLEYALNSSSKPYTRAYLSYGDVPNEYKDDYVRSKVTNCPECKSTNISNHVEWDEQNDHHDEPEYEPEQEEGEEE
jgi:hypothetical protein